MIEQLTQSWLCWAILLLALVCYQQLWLDYFSRRAIAKPLEHGGEQPLDQAEQRQFLGVLIGALPLLGLLGTIIGLLECFSGIASQGASSERISGGIADALLTTQLGLVCAIPGWLLLSWLQASARQALQPITPNMAR